MTERLGSDPSCFGRDCYDLGLTAPQCALRFLSGYVLELRPAEPRWRSLL
jgi:hypothetical protein